MGLCRPDKKQCWIYLLDSFVYSFSHKEKLTFFGCQSFAVRRFFNNKSIYVTDDVTGDGKRSYNSQSQTNTS